ncbi:DHA2 family efflux MFS transporter permease subunit [Kitasatospora sp. NPDC051170]|uniref:DHA2 family efflux MFS transporter permease subunit n=1 Tax=Kitasatospora sp. NPDC051170 TaxID=3364056 RepID=UPI0037B0BC4F
MTLHLTAAPAPAATPPRRSALARTVAVVVTGSLLSVLDTTIVNVALRRLTEVFHAPIATVQWATTAYTLALAAVIPTAAWAMARLGAKRTYLLALALFTAGSLLAACAWDIGALIAFRALQGLGGGLLMPVGMTMVMRAADRTGLGRAMALLGLPVLVGPVAGPVLGGWLLDTVSWRWMFLVNLPVGLLALVLARRLLLPDAPREPASQAPKLDLPGLLMLSPGLALLLYALAGEHPAWPPAAAGALLIAAWTRRSLTIRHPLINLRLLRDRTFASAAATQALFTCGYFGSMLLAPLYWQQVRGQGAMAAGLLGAPVGLAVGVTMQIASRRLDAIGPRRLVPPGVALGALGMALTAWQSGQADVPAWRVVTAAMVMGTGAGMVLMPTMTTATRHLPQDELAAATTALSINSQLCASIGTALTSTTLAAAGTAPAGFRTAYTLAAAALALALLPAWALVRRRG